MTRVALASAIQYSGVDGNASWSGRRVDDRERFTRYLREVVRPRVSDSSSAYEPDLRGLATTGMGTEFVERLLQSVPDPEAWEIGEALAECALETDSGREIHWPWNTVRDRRTPRASLPGTDLVGFCTQHDEVLLVFGEVKTSSEATSPPNVMYGGSGMTWQLEASATRTDIQRALLQWLHARCTTEPSRTLFRQAVGRFLESGGKELVVVGVLVRDTAPHEADLQGRCKVLSQKLGAPTQIELFAWYLPVPIAAWPTLLQEEAP